MLKFWKVTKFTVAQTYGFRLGILYFYFMTMSSQLKEKIHVIFRNSVYYSAIFKLWRRIKWRTHSYFGEKKLCVCLSTKECYENTWWFYVNPYDPRPRYKLEGAALLNNLSFVDYWPKEKILIQATTFLKEYLISVTECSGVNQYYGIVETTLDQN